MSPESVGVVVVTVLVVVVAAALWRAFRTRRAFGTLEQRVAYATLHTATLAAPPLRAGLSPTSAAKAGKHLRSLLAVRALAIVDAQEVLAWDGPHEGHADQALVLARQRMSSGHVAVLGPDEVSCGDQNCPLTHAVVAPVTGADEVIGALVAYDTTATPGSARAAHEVARWVSTQLDLAELDRSRNRAMEADLRALRAQISPHFIYNSLTAIASYVRTDPEHARDLLMDFADFTRYSFRRHGDYTTLAEELRSVDRYLALEKARFGDRLQVTLRIAPEVLPVAVPFLCLQPMVENAVRHGLEGAGGTGQITIVAADEGADARITVEDDGLGMDPDRVRRALAGEPGVDSVGLGNVDERLRSVYGDEYGLVVETAPGAGTKVIIRVPKYRHGVRAS